MNFTIYIFALVSILIVFHGPCLIRGHTLIQCGDKTCGKNANCTHISGMSPKCICNEGYSGLSYEVCFKTCHSNFDCPGSYNECRFHDPYFPRYDNINLFVYNYPYPHNHCQYDCNQDEDCATNAVCQSVDVSMQIDDGIKKLQCQCLSGYVGLPYLKCFNPNILAKMEMKTIDIEGSTKCPILERLEGVKVSCLDPDGTEHDCKTGGIRGTSAMFTCKPNYSQEDFKMKFARMKCGSNLKWYPLNPFKCVSSKHPFLRYNDN